MIFLKINKNYYIIFIAIICFFNFLFSNETVLEKVIRERKIKRAQHNNNPHFQYQLIPFISTDSNQKKILLSVLEKGYKRRTKEKNILFNLDSKVIDIYETFFPSRSRSIKKELIKKHKLLKKNLYPFPLAIDRISDLNKNYEILFFSYHGKENYFDFTLENGKKKYFIFRYISSQLLIKPLKVISVYKAFDDVFIVLIEERFYGKEKLLTIKQTPLVLNIKEILNNPHYQIFIESEWKLKEKQSKIKYFTYFFYKENLKSSYKNRQFKINGRLIENFSLKD